MAGLDEKIIALYDGEMTTSEIETYITELYEPEVSADVPRHRRGARDEKAWQTRPLEQIYSIL